MQIKPAPRLMFASFVLASFAAAALPGNLLAAGGAVAEQYTLQLTSGGQIEGELLNPKEAPRTKYVVRLADGSELTLPRDQVRDLQRVRPEEAEYAKIRHQYPDTVDGQWQLAEWCREHNLHDIRKRHLERIIELDPNHAESRRLLGYAKFDGAWKTKAQEMTDRGYVEYKGRWLLRQEVELLEQKTKDELAEKAWINNLKRWRENLDVPDRQVEAKRKIADIRDPAAIPAIRKLLEVERVDAVRVLLIEPIAKTGAWSLLAELSLYDPSQEVRMTCLDYLDDAPHPDIVTLYIQKLHDKSNPIVNLAAVGLKRMRDPAAIAPLIDALTTTHVTTIAPANSGQYSASFGPNGSGFGMNMNQPVSKRYDLNNEAVLDALVSLSPGGVNYNFDKAAWKRWYDSQRKTSTLNARRD